MLGGNAVHLVSGDAEEEAVNLRAHLAGERRVGAVAANLGARGTVILVVVIGARTPKRGCRRHGHGDSGDHHVLRLLLRFHWRGSRAAGRVFWRCIGLRPRKMET
jgi:hypothetical protein